MLQKYNINLIFPIRISKRIMIWKGSTIHAQSNQTERFRIFKKINKIMKSSEKTSKAIKSINSNKAEQELMK